MGTFVPNTQSEQQEMLSNIGFQSMEQLFSDIPKEVFLKNPLNIPKGLSELEVRKAIENLASKNVVFKTIFRGAGAYNHYIPSIVKYIPAKEEFLTAYTPYQAELSQGILQSIFEYQTMICELTGMDASNASTYDSASAAAEAVIMCKERSKNKAILFDNVHPHTKDTIKTYCGAKSGEVVVLPSKEGEGLIDLEALKNAIDKTTACVYLQQPNFYGLLETPETLAEIEKLVHENGAKLIVGVNPVSLAVLNAPSEYGADIVVGDAQPFGMPLGFGGPYLGFMACKAKLTRQLPGRIAGETTDLDGKRAFVLTLQAREQHIRREKASSSICTNHALCALTASVYLSAMGKDGLAEVATQCMSKAKYAANKICSVKGFELAFKGQFFNEFVTKCNANVSAIMDKLQQHGILGGYPLKKDGYILWCVTEMNTKEEIDNLVEILGQFA